MIKKLPLWFLGSIISVAVYAQTPASNFELQTSNAERLTPEEAVRIALENNYDIRHHPRRCRNCPPE
jgi:hypothetical protein